MYPEKIGMPNTNWHKALLKANNACRCGARTRKLKSCEAPAMPNGRCRMHGGKSTGAPSGNKHGKYKNGYYTKTAIEERRQLHNLIKQVKNSLKDLEILT